MLGQIADFSAPQLIKQATSYQPPRSSDLNLFDFHLWGQLKPQCIRLCLEGRDSSPA